MLPGGKILHAAKDATERNALRRAAIAVDRARTSRVRSDPQLALRLWDDLVSGRWTLVDRFDSDGRRILVAHRNDPPVTQRSKLTEREQDVLQRMLGGQSNKLIANHLSVTEATVSERLTHALGKLNLRSIADLRRLFGSKE